MLICRLNRQKYRYVVSFRTKQCMYINQSCILSAAIFSFQIRRKIRITPGGWAYPGAPQALPGCEAGCRLDRCRAHSAWLLQQAEGQRQAVRRTQAEQCAVQFPASTQQLHRRYSRGSAHSVGALNGLQSILNGQELFKLLCGSLGPNFLSLIGKGNQDI